MPPPFPQPVRTAARALIVHEGRLLTIELADAHGRYSLLPGGGQLHGETLVQTVRRECLEEIGCKVRVGRMLYVRKYIGRNHSFNRRHRAFHQVEAVFECELEPDQVPALGPNKDPRQVDIRWIELSELSRTRFYPEAIKGWFGPKGLLPPDTYLGDMN